MRNWRVPDVEGTQEPQEPASIIKRRIDQRIDEILDLWRRDPAEAMNQARRLREWVERQGTTGQAELDRQEALTEVIYLIAIFQQG
jgi:hypothetical protein